MSRPRHRSAMLAMVMGVLVAASGLATAQKDEPRRAKGAADLKGNHSTQLASGVITKVEDVTKEGRDRPRFKRLTINTAAVWRDYVRDQATVKPDASLAEVAAKGANSVATKGEPKSEDTLVTVGFGPETKATLRFRSSTDEASTGAATPAGAAKKEDPSAGASDRHAPKSIAVNDLRPGLFVEVEYRHVRDHNRASSVTVLRPIGGPDTPASEATPSGRPARSSR